MPTHPRFSVLSSLLFLVCLTMAISSAGAASKILMGIDVLEKNRFSILQGKRVGLLTHKAGVNRNGVSSIDVLHKAPQVHLRALYGPEHGIDGVAEAEVKIREGCPRPMCYWQPRHPKACTTEIYLQNECAHVG